jgi:hypothetical protein
MQCSPVHGQELAEAFSSQGIRDQSRSGVHFPYACGSLGEQLCMLVLALGNGLHFQ